MVQLQVNQEISKVDDWLKRNKLTLNYKKSIYMIIGNKLPKGTAFKLTINHNVIPQTNNTNYLEVV